jgi:Na+/H+ antiporter NhaD/arsenite permease-like protein
MLLPVLVFVLTYILMILLPNHRHWVALASAAFYLISGTLPLKELSGAIDWNILLMLFGTMGTVSFFIASKMPERLSESLLRLAPNTMWAVVILSLFAGLISAFMDNVATVLMIAPIGLAVSRQLKISPVPMLICISVSSNLQGAATLVGDTTSIMLGSYAKMDFLDFFFFHGKPSMFWAVELGALATIPVILFLFRKYKTPVTISARTEVTDVVPTVFLCANILLLISASFLPNKPEFTNGLICVGVFVLLMLYSLLRTKRTDAIRAAFREVDYRTLLLLAALFVVIAGVEAAGLMKVLANALVSAGRGKLLLVYTIVVWGSVLCSAFIDNIPFVATMLPVVTDIAASMGCAPYVLYFGLLSGATLGGNLTPIGASANIAAIGILRKEGYSVKNKDFLRIGLPFTFVAVLVGYLYCWFVWA